MSITDTYALPSFDNGMFEACCQLDRMKDDWIWVACPADIGMIAWLNPCRCSPESGMGIISRKLIEVGAGYRNRAMPPGADIVKISDSTLAKAEIYPEWFPRRRG